MTEEYRTVSREASDEIVIKKSRFIGFAGPAATEEEAAAFIERIKKEHWSATHNCSAYVVGPRGEYQRSSDDGEPSGTAGRPILEVIKHRGLTNVVVVVTRYFGGIMLGAGGLVRAYTDGAVIALNAAGPIRKALHRELIVDIDYTWYGKLENEIRNRGALVADTQFSDRVTVTLLPFAKEADSMAAWITDLTQGQASITMGESRYLDHPI
ncbi:YigZ family protein [Paenibacillus thermoaerophilus]|uniref:YigZ family protein n=1 Tax=Paenibacillus thermoaerophilus TaxID=1215385 RepID=A0ABW2UZA3_9BACL|nr:YigZ family protein [Paenibacillus thermoaerophilus]TMV17423.1 YigZ family protein [Paenibacillus thermoaerophilus]